MAITILHHSAIFTAHNFLTPGKSPSPRPWPTVLLSVPTADQGRASYAWLGTNYRGVQKIKRTEGHGERIFPNELNARPPPTPNPNSVMAIMGEKANCATYASRYLENVKK